MRIQKIKIALIKDIFMFSFSKYHKINWYLIFNLTKSCSPWKIKVIVNLYNLNLSNHQLIHLKSIIWHYKIETKHYLAVSNFWNKFLFKNNWKQIFKITTLLLLLTKQWLWQLLKITIFYYILKIHHLEIKQKILLNKFLKCFP